MMRHRGFLLLAMALGAAGIIGLAQDAPQAPGSLPVIKTETRVVLVDAVVTDKKDNYIRDLEQKNFKIWEDSKEQTITSFAFEADPNSPNASQKHYMVLLFDNSTMDTGDQMRARQAATKFIEANAGPNRLMAVLNYAGSISVAQNFTADANRLKQVVSGVKFSPVSPNEPVELASTSMPSGIPNLGRAEAAFGVWDELLALRSMAKLLAPIQGRKMVIMLTSGFVVRPENMSELTAAISECNRANVAIYPIDVRGLATGLSTAPIGAPGAGGPPGPPGASLVNPSRPSGFSLIPVSFGGSGSMSNSFFQHGGGGTGGGGTGGGGTGTGGGGGRGGGTGGPGGTGSGGGKSGSGSSGSGGKGSGGGSPSTGNGNTLNPNTVNPYNQSRMLIPPLLSSVSDNQQVLFALASGTGGFVIVNTNDLLGGLEKIGKEQDQFYLLGYTPPESEEGSCHFLKVKVDRPGLTVRFRNGYCNVKPVDVLAGNPVEKDLENRVAGSAPGVAGAAMSAPFFFTAANTARVDVALDIPAEAIKFEKNHGKFHADLNILAIAYRPDGSVAARFSDTKKIEVENKKDVQAFNEHPYHYDSQFDIASGQYTLKAAFGTGGSNFGKVEAPLSIDPYDSKQFGLSSLVLSKDIHRATDVGSDLDEVLLEGRTPLIASGFQFTPAAVYRFKTTEHPALYAEIYDPHMTGQTAPVVGVQLRVLDRKTQEVKVDSGLGSATAAIRKGSPVIPLGLKLPVDKLSPGGYRVEVKAVDSMGGSKTRTVDFDVEQ
jgi:VWFA-related protein